MNQPLSQNSIPRGFHFAAVAAGVKYRGRLDVALAEAPGGAATAALFTANLVKAAPLIAGARNLQKSGRDMRAVIVNSGNANCANGRNGLKNCDAVCAALARELGARASQIFPGSTGVIGMPFPADHIIAAIPELTRALSDSPAGVENFARAIMTTDTRPKVTTARFSAGGKEVRLLGIAKGAGMIHPNMATMLAYVFTDAKASPAHLRDALQVAAAQSFNCISVDGDTSTNDTLALFASGAAGVALSSPPVKKFQAALNEVCASLAAEIISDGEGVQHVIRLHVEQARDEREAHRIGNTIATSMLVKTAFAGADPNWGRILAAIGRAGMTLDATKVDIYLGEQQLCRRGQFHPFDEPQAHAQMSQQSYDIRVVLRRGRARTMILTTDLTADYVRINADYRT